MRFIFGVLVLATAAGLAYVRLAPHDVSAVHQPVEKEEDADLAIGAVRVLETDLSGFEMAVAYMQGLPRTSVLAGGVDAGIVTFVTRSQVFGFPDYTTLDFRNGILRVHARLRFGQSDLGVNRQRLEGLIAHIQ